MQIHKTDLLDFKALHHFTHLAFIWLFLAAASLAVMGSGRVEGTEEFLGKIHLNKLKNTILKEKKSLQIEETYLDFFGFLNLQFQ